MAALHLAERGGRSTHEANQNQTANEDRSTVLCSRCPLKTTVVMLMTVLEIVGTIVTTAYTVRLVYRHISDYYCMRRKTPTGCYITEPVSQPKTSKQTKPV